MRSKGFESQDFANTAGNPLLDRQRLGDFYIHFHFLHFAKLYNSERGANEQMLTAARLHLQVSITSAFNAIKAAN